MIQLNIEFHYNLSHMKLWELGIYFCCILEFRKLLQRQDFSKKFHLILFNLETICGKPLQFSMFEDISDTYDGLLFLVLHQDLLFSIIKNYYFIIIPIFIFNYLKILLSNSHRKKIEFQIWRRWPKYMELGFKYDYYFATSIR